MEGISRLSYVYPQLYMVEGTVHEATVCNSSETVRRAQKQGWGRQVEPTQGSQRCVPIIQLLARHALAISLDRSRATTALKLFASKFELAKRQWAMEKSVVKETSLTRILSLCIGAAGP